MATNELPGSEGPSAAAPKHSIFRKPLPASPFSKPKSLLGEDRSSLQAFDKETAVESFPESPPDTVPAAVAPNTRKYFGLRPRIWIIIAVVTVVLLALIIGLAVGLHHKSYALNLSPIPILNTANPHPADPSLRRTTSPFPPTPASSLAT